MRSERRLHDLQLRRERLLVRSAELRAAIAENSRALGPPLALVDQLRAGLRWLRAHPEWPAGALVVMLVLRPRRLLVWSGRAWWVWRLLRQGRRALRSLAFGRQ
jgi:YqjK-like protein